MIISTEIKFVLEIKERGVVQKFGIMLSDGTFIPLSHDLAVPIIDDCIKAWGNKRGILLSDNSMLEVAA